MYTDNRIYLGLADGERVTMPLSMCNRHGLIAGASGTGKTITMKVMAESFSDAGVPVFLCDVKGDVSGLAMPGAKNDSMEKRIDKFGLRGCFTYKSYPVSFWDIYGKGGHSVRATVSELGPDLLARILGLTPAQEGVLNIVFRIADDRGYHLYDMKDLRAMLTYVSEHREEFLNEYGSIAAQTIGGIVRSLLPLENQGGDIFFGEPELDIMDWIRTNSEGHGYINLLDCTELVRNPTLYATFLLWLMSELFERLPEVGDMGKPKLVFFFDEAHMLFSDAPKVLVQKIEQLVKLIRSKGVGIYFVTQSPGDIPDSVLAQLSNRIQHALRAYTPAEQKAVRIAAGSMRPNPAFDASQLIMELGVGHALVSVLDDEGVPCMVQNTAIICPQSLMAPADDAARQSCMSADGMDKYDTPVDSESAYEMLRDEREAETERSKLEAERAQLEKEKAELEKQKQKEHEAKEKQKQKENEAKEKKKEREAERRRSRIERELINVGKKALKRGLLGTLLK